ncbi:MAG: hypothetical protein AAGF95_21930 [Chloroflexota bacterium]
MQRLINISIVFVLLITTGLNIALLVQNTQLRNQVANPRVQEISTAPNQEQADEIAELEERLERAEEDRIEASREAASLRTQVERLGPAADNQTSLQEQLEALEAENERLRNEVTNLQTMNEINGQVVDVRGLVPTGSVPREFMNREELRAYFTDVLEEEFSEEAERDQRSVLQALDMDRGGPDLREDQIDELARSVLGFYNHETKDLVVVTERATMGTTDQMTYAHEFAHSLQDQYYDLGALFERAQGNSDYETAIRSLVEGDAMVTMSLYAETFFSDMDLINYQLEQIQNLDLTGFLYGGGGPYVESAAAFPYNEGSIFVSTLYQVGGWEEVTRAFNNPPRSTEQIIHPQKYYDGDEPVAVALPDLATGLGGSWELVSENTLGELYTRIYLQRFVSFNESVLAGEGWGGDRYQVLRDDRGRLGFTLLTAWDTPNDAQEFFTITSAFVMARGGGNPETLVSTPTQMRWQLADRQYHLSLVDNQVLLLHAPDGPTLDGLLGQFQGF